MSQYNLTITYIRSEENTITDALSRLPPNCFSSENSVNAVLRITANCDILEQIKAGYLEDEFCKWVALTSMKGWSQINGLWYIGDHLLIPHVTDIRENLFKLAHDTLGHFGANKSYVSLHNAYYWPNMRTDLEQAYIPVCTDCLRNKSPMACPAGPLHLLPVPDRRGASIAMDFIGLLPLDSKYDCILSITDQLGSDIRMVPTRTNLTAEELAGSHFFLRLVLQKWPAYGHCLRP